MDSLFPVLLFVTIVVVIAIYNAFFSEIAKIRRAIRAARKVAIADVKSGEVVRISGKVRPTGPLLEAPLSRRPCVYFEVSVEEYRSNGKNGRWVEIIHETDTTDFLVVDGTGKALVRSAEMRVLTVRDHQRESGTWNDATPDLEAYLARHGRQSKGWVFNKNIRYREGVFEPDEQITVLGEATWEHDPDPTEAGSGYRDSPKRLVVRSRPDGLLLASDEPELT